MKLKRRPRRNRQTVALRDLVRENSLTPSALIWPVFVCEGQNQREKIESLPGVFRLSLDILEKEVRSARALGIKSLALFPKVEPNKKNDRGSEALNANNLSARAAKKLKEAFPDLCLISDVALDPYTSHGHDGLIKGEKILNDETVEVLAQMAVLQAQSGVDMVAPSDMMDGRVAAIRTALDNAGHTETGIMAYTAKYASAFYGPFRDALQNKLAFGDKRTYQMDPGNRREAILEAKLDYQEGADILMVKPGLSYLDIVWELKRRFPVPIAAYNVSGEYAMVKAAAQNGWLNEKAAVLEILLSFKRAGADMVLTYHAVDAAKWLNEEG
ncbi:MAG: porphobilinogen synthase [Bdellovibrionales bacterium]